MSPWQENTYFKTPVLEKVSLAPSVVSTVNSPDPQTIALLISFSSLNSGGTPIVWPASNVSGSTGIVLNTNQPYLLLLQKEVGPLVTMQWYGTVWAGSGATVSAITIALNQWPSEAKKSMSDNQLSGVQAAINALSRQLAQLGKQQKGIENVLRTIATTK